MPIPIDEFEKKQRPIEERLLAFFGAQPDQAFSLPEIVAALENYEGTTRLALALSMMTVENKDLLIKPYLAALQILVERGQVRFARHQAQDYFAAAPRR